MMAKSIFIFLAVLLLAAIFSACNKDKYILENPEWEGVWVSCYNCDSVGYSAVISILESGEASWDYENYVTGQRIKKKGRFKIQNGNELYIGRQQFTIEKTRFDSTEVYQHAFMLDTIYYSRSLF